MAEEKKTNKPVKDHWLTIDGVKKEAKRVRWPKWKSEGNTNGIAANTAEVLIFSGFFAAFFVFCDFVVTFLLRFIGIGA
ncbi:MAG: preprotein translocase subunit SecE [Erysipelotrichaceae bacterium]|jgi:preprotein translocase subunit SecE|nr:preprotein translocase subunit SecE [Erysipelotrichaceae bacterium]